ncbi:MAG: hypothetical protein ACREMV_09620 [Gemmatimonadales bacterium]
MRAELRLALRAAMIAAPLTLGLAACGREAAGPDTAPLDQTEALLIGQEIAAEVQDIAGSFEPDGVLGPVFPALALHPLASGLCVTFDPADPDDADGDGVPTELTVTFDCSFSSREKTVELTGTVLITDPSATDFGFRFEFTELRHRVTYGEHVRLRQLDGVVQLVRSTTELSIIDQTTTRQESSGRDPVVIAKDWDVHFIVDEGLSFDGWRRLPSGTLTINGSMVRTRGERSFALEVETVVGLHFDATCEADQKFDGGQLLVTKTGGDRSGTVQIDFTGCGEEPVVTFLPPPGA